MTIRTFQSTAVGVSGWGGGRAVRGVGRGSVSGTGAATTPAPSTAGGSVSAREPTGRPARSRTAHVSTILTKGIGIERVYISLIYTQSY